MSASQSGVFSVQEFTDLGTPLAGGRLYTYIFGTTTQKTAYTDIAGSVPHTYTSDGLGGQYIALNARGELPAPLYLSTGSYDLALKTASGATVWTRRADPAGDIPVSLANVSGLLPIANGGTGATTAIAARAALGVAPRSTRIDVASVAGTVNLTTFAPDTDDIQITGSLAITAFTVATDRVIRVRAGGAFTLTNNANIVTQTGANIIASAGDTFMLRATAANVVEVLGYSSGGTGFPQLTASVTSNALTIVLTSTVMDFRNATLTSGAITRAPTGTISITVPSAATLGSVSGTVLRVGVAVAYNGGTPVLCVVNGTVDESALYSPTTISTGATAIGTVYSASAVSASSPMRLIGYVDVPNVTAGTYATITQVQSYGGTLSPSTFGVGQSPTNVAGSRSAGVTYFNTSGRPRYVSITSNISVGIDFQLLVNSIGISRSAYNSATNGVVFVSGVVPPGFSYSLTASAGTVSNWIEY